MEATNSPELDLNNLRAIKVLGKGAMGTVLLVHHQLSDPAALSPFALKVVEKASLYTNLDAHRRARWEVSVLTRLKDPTHPFLPSLIGSSETHEFLVWAVPFCPGGDLNVLRLRQSDTVFSPSVIRFYLAEIVCALEHLHTMGIVYRDLKPENILIQSSGHVTLTDFDLSRNLTKTLKTVMGSVELPAINRENRRNLFSLVVTNKFSKMGLKKAKCARVSPVNRAKLSFENGERSNSFVGTEEYVSPEVVNGDGHEFAVDWWALGVLSYEMLYGTTPFRGVNRKDTFRRILMMPPEFPGRPTELSDLIGQLLEKDPTRRLGYKRGACEIKDHQFFRGLSWDLLTEVLRPPFLPSKDDVDLTGISLTNSGTGVKITDYFQKLRLQSSPLNSPSIDEFRHHVSLTEF